MAELETKQKKQEKDKTKVIQTQGIIPRGRSFTGKVISRKMQKTANIEWERRFYLKKYERYEKRKSHVKAHVPEDMMVKEGDIVTIKECRPISKTKHFIVVKNESN